MQICLQNSKFETRRAAGLTDRGALEPGLRGDVIRFREVNGTPVVRGTWVKGKRVA